MRQAVLVLALVLLAVATAFGQDEPPAAKPDWQTALEAFRAKDETTLSSLAAATKEDPWLVADALCAAAEFDAAAAFASCVKQGGCEKLAAYVTSRRAARGDDTVRKAYAAADAALRAGRNAEALEICEGVSTTGTDVPSLQLANAHGYALRVARRYDDALDVLRDAVEAADSLGWVRHAWRLSTSAAQIEMRIGNALVGSATYAEAVEFAEQLGDKRALASACMDATTAYLECSVFGDALAMAKRALALHEELGDKAAVAGDTINMGLAYLRSGRLDDALTHFQKGLAAALDAGHKQYAANAMSSMGVVMTLKKDYDKAVEWNSKSRALLEELHDERGVAGSWGNIGRIRMDQGRLDDAKASFEKALAIQENAGLIGDAARSHGALAAIAMRQNRPADAAVEYEKLLEILIPTKLMNDIIPVRAELGLACDAAGDKVRAERQFREVWPFLDLLIDPATSRRVREAVARMGLNLDARGPDAPDEVDAEEVENSIRSARTRWKTASDALAKGDKGTAMGELRDAAADLAAGRPEAAAARVELDAMFRTGVQMGVDVNDASTVYYFLALRRARVLVGSLAARNGSLPWDGQPLSAARAQRTLLPGMAYVVFGVFDDETFAVVLTPDTRKLVKLGPTKAIADACAKLDAGDVAKDAEPAAAELRKLLVAPLALPAGASRLSIGAADEPLASVPFSLLLPDREIACLPTPEVAVHMANPAKAGEEFLVVGSDDDAKALGASRLDPATTTWSAFTERLESQPSWYVVALTNKVVPDPDDAHYSALEFAPADGKRTVDGATVSQANVPVRALVLTGGAAARTAVMPGDGSWRLPNEFIAAGAHGVIASLWDPDPAATRAFVGHFVERWSGKTTKSAALKAAQEYVRGQPQWKHPRFWAGWVLTGFLD